MKIEQKVINTIRLLSADIIENSKSGHPGLPLGFAPAAFTLWSKHIRQNPQNPNWIGRDRFVLSAGHGSSLLYSLLHLWNYNLSMEDLKKFRKIGSKTPGHPEYGHTQGIEVTTGPLGQGIANAVGMAISEAHLSSIFNKDDFDIINNFTYVVCGDGCLQEGVSAEAVSLAGNLKLGKLILLYDSNNITIEGDTKITFTENVLDRFKAYGWHTQFVKDGNNINDIDEAIQNAKNEKDMPSIIEIKTKIGYGSPNAGSSKVHGEPLGADGILQTKKYFEFDTEKHFHVDEDVKEYLKNIINKLKECEEEHNALISVYKEKYPSDYENLKKYIAKEIPNLDKEDFWNYTESLATRQSSEIVLNKIADILPNLVGGSADLSPSTKTIMKKRESFSSENYKGSNFHFGVREHAMSAIANGMYLYGGVIPYVSGFFVFSDYQKAAIRLSAIMGLPIINIFTHDSIGVGEDGPTHQPIEQLASLRSIPNFTVIRPCDTKEVAAAWLSALNSKNPTAIILTRQKTTLLKETGKEALKGAYILRDFEEPNIILIATGSEVELIYKAFDILVEKGQKPRVVSMPSFELFEIQSNEYKENIFPKNIRARLAVEAGTSYGWGKYIGLDGDIISIESFGDSGEASSVFKKFGFTVENVVDRALKVIENNK
ncbi:MAG: transketolase [Defluviitaleaceae bacterium]|nr:transketolase [Defluviitaleaceae bacterium]